MEIEFDPVKDAANVKKHGLAFIDIPALKWENAIIIQDTCKDYGEKRMVAFLYGDSVLYSVAYTERNDKRRIISFRRAREQERANHARRI